MKTKNQHSPQNQSAGTSQSENLKDPVKNDTDLITAKPIPDLGSDQGNTDGVTKQEKNETKTKTDSYQDGKYIINIHQSENVNIGDVPPESNLPLTSQQNNVNEQLQEVSPSLRQISNPNNYRGDVIFVHGLEGNGVNTWHPETQPNQFWPQWLGQECPSLAVWSLEYNISRSQGTSLVDQAGNLLRKFNAKTIGQRPLIFITYDLGGLLVKELLRCANNNTTNLRWQNIFNQTKGVIFISVPSSSNNIDSWINHLEDILRRQDPIDTEFSLMTPDRNYFLALNSWWDQKSSGIQQEVYFPETSTVIDRYNADVGLENIRPCLIEQRNHSSISRQVSQNDLVYTESIQFIKDCFLTQVQKTDDGFLFQNNENQSEVFLLPKNPPSRMEKHEMEQNLEFPQIWKKVHHISEKLHYHFSIFYEKILLYKEARDLQNLERASSHLSKSSEKLNMIIEYEMNEAMNDIIDLIEKVPNASLLENKHYIKFIKNDLLNYLIAIKKSLEFNHDIQAIEHDVCKTIKNWLSEALRYADRVLTKYIESASQGRR
jgi:hypothetical protein